MKEIQQLLIHSNFEMGLARYLKALYVTGCIFLYQVQILLLGRIFLVHCSLWPAAVCSGKMFLFRYTTCPHWGEYVPLGAARISVYFFSIYAYRVISRAEESQISNILIHGFFAITLWKTQQTFDLLASSQFPVSKLQQQFYARHSS